MTRFLSAAILLASLATALSAAPVPKSPPDPLPSGATARLGSNAFRGPHAHGLTFSADGKKLLARDMKDFLRDDKNGLSAWDVESGKTLAQTLTPPRFETPTDGAVLIRSVPLCDRVVWLVQARARASTTEAVVADFEGKVINRFHVAGQPNLSLQNRAELAGAAVAPSGHYLAATSQDGREVAAYDLNTGKKVVGVKDGLQGLPRVCFSRGRDVLFVKSAGKPIRRFDPATGKELPELAGTDDEVTCVAESPNGKWLVSGRRYVRKLVDGKQQAEQVKFLEVRDGATGKLARKLEIAGAPEAFAFAGTDSLIVQTDLPAPPAIGTATLSRWNVATGKREWEVPGAGLGVIISPDGKRFATAGPRLIFLYDSETGKRLVDPNGHTGTIRWVAFSADGKSVTTAGPGEVITWTTSGQRKQTVAVPELRDQYPGAAECLWSAANPVKPRTVTIFGWDREEARVGWRMEGVPDFSQVGTPDGKQVVCVRLDPRRPRDETVTVYDGPAGKKIGEWSYSCPKDIKNVYLWPRAISGDGRFMVVGDNAAVRILEVATGKEYARVPVEDLAQPQNTMRPILTVAADGSKLAVIGRGAARVYDVKTGKALASYTFKDNPPPFVTFSPDGKMLAMRYAGGAQGATVLVWEFLASGATPKPDTAEPWATASCVTFSPDGKTLAVGYTDGTALLWDLTGKK